MESMSLFLYRAFGLLIASEFELPELCRDSSRDPADVVIRQGSVPEQLPGATTILPIWQAKPGAFLLQVPEVGRYLVTDGTTVVVDPQPGIAAGDLRIYLLGTAMGALLHQREVLPFHASAVEVGGQAVLFAGVSGAGKSTLAAHLRQRGFRLLADDVTAITFDQGMRPWVHGGFPRLKLWSDALRHIEHDRSALQRDHTRLEKYHLPVPGEWRPPVLPLREVVILNENREGEEVVVTTLRGLDAVDALAHATYRPRLLKALGREKGNFVQCSAIGNSSSVVRLLRPKLMAQIDALLDTLEARWMGHP